MNKPPAFQFYANDWLGSTQIMLMTPAEEGAYIRLLAIAWNDPDCCLPNDDEKLAKLSRLGEAWLNGSGAIIRKCFTVKGDKIYNERLLREKRKIEQFRKERSESGKRGAESKWGKMPGSARKKRTTRLKEARKKSKHTQEEFQEMVNFFDGVCVKCGSKDGVLKDHIIPIYQGGSDGIKNLQPLCKKCNSSKGSDSTDYRISYCIKNKLKLPKKWLAEPLAKGLAKNSSSSSFSNNNILKEYIIMSKLLGELILKRSPNDFHVKKAQKNGWVKWAESIRKMVEEEGCSLEEIEKVIKWCQEDDFWKTNIRSTSKLRLQFGQLIDKMKNKKKEPEYEHPQANQEWLK